jgi:hypothetical protein
MIGIDEKASVGDIKIYTQQRTIGKNLAYGKRFWLSKTQLFPVFEFDRLLIGYKRDTRANPIFLLQLIFINLTVPVRRVLNPCEYPMHVRLPSASAGEAQG